MHCDDLESSVETAEISKRIALERELCSLDIAIAKLRGGRCAVAEAAASLNDEELVAQHSELAARLDAAEAQLLALPTCVVEPPYVGLVMDEPALLAGFSSFGRVVAPRAITAADLTLEGAPSRAYPGCTLQCRLVPRGARHTSQSAEELGMSMSAATAATHLEAMLKTEGVVPQPLKANIGADMARHCIFISIVVPATARVGSSVCFGPLTVSGQPVAGLPGALRVEPPGPADLSPEHAAWLQSQLPPGGSSSPGSWEEVYRATTHGFDGKAFHERRDGRVRLLVLVRAREGGWLFGGFTAVGFIPGLARAYADPSAFLFSLTNSLGRPDKIKSKQKGSELYYGPNSSAWFFGGLTICGDADTMPCSMTWTGNESFAAASSPGAHPMARGRKGDWLAAEVVAWVV